ncbi:unnamed protein product [Hermetia illucens]|uniref:Uncharacterized protein n=1 Tax=Hermetia illucens TaxID=343691 RepID=A0A7R8UGS5_HERIL|nr:unnamed protein product [Hermetia illucens]
MSLAEIYWSKFDRTQDQLSPFEEIALEHSYSANYYHEDVRKVCEKLIIVWKDGKSKLEGTTSDADTMAISSKGKFKNTAGPKGSERQAEFEF